MTNRKSRTPRIFLAALGLTVGLGAAAPQTAEACGGGWWPEIQIDHRVQGIATAEKQLNMGRYKDAAASVIRMIPHIRSYAWATSDTIINRSLRVLAVSTVRSDGKLDLGRQVPRELQNQWLGSDSEDRQANLLWAANTLRNINKLKKNDPAMQTELGEALAKLDAHKSEARSLLGKLAAKDLLASPEGYAALAGLKKAAGDEDGGKTAYQRCVAMAEDASVCGFNQS